MDHIHDSRRIFTDGRDWPKEMQPSFSGYSIGKWIDEDGDGRYDWYFRSPDGESYETFAGRVADWLGESEQPSLIVVVTHGLVTRVLRGLYIGLPRAVALTLPVPQDRIFRLSAGEIEELAVLGDQVGDRG